MILLLSDLKINLSSAVIFALICGTVFIMLFSWFLSIKYKRYHGIARFFAFESVFILILLNWKSWFREPFSIAQIISWLFLTYSLYVVIAGFLTLKRRGKPDSNFENTSVLVKSGIYGRIRHPLYLSIFLFGSGVMLKQIGIPQLCLGAINLIAIYITARIEEKEMIAKFGQEYKIYMDETKMFIPFLL